jgi:hypothetical protein
MDANWTLDPALLDNAHEFTGDFYRRFRLRPADRPLQLTDTIAKDYLFPTFYGDVVCAVGVFLCSYERASALMPHPRVVPVRMTRGRAVVAFSCYEYRKVLGVAPYNEIAMTIPVMVDPGINVPVLPMILDVFRNFGYFVFSMPVTSLENRTRGHQIWGLPKEVQRIDIAEEGGLVTTRAFEPGGEPYFELTVPTTGKPQLFDVTSNLYSRLGDRFLQSETNFRGVFNVTKFMDLLVKKGKRPGRDWLVLHDTPCGRVLKDLEIEPHPFQFRFAANLSSCFDLPNVGFASAVSFER